MKIFRRFFGDRSTLQSTANQLPDTPVTSFEHSIDDRRRRDDIPYLLPKDFAEGERLNLQHYLLRYAMKGNFMAPVGSQVQQILDVGCGTGIWGQEVARQFPQARVFGLDLESSNALSLTASMTTPPANYHFVQGNVLHGLPFADRTFDFTHQRMLVLALQASHWPGVIKDLMRVTKPGGWIELLELGGTIYQAGPATEQMMALAAQFLRQRGFDLRIAEQIGTLLHDAGLAQVEQHLLDIPIGTWDTHLGTLLEQNILSAFTAIKAGVCAQASIAPAEYDRLLASLPKEWKAHRSYHRFYLAYGHI